MQSNHRKLAGFQVQGKKELEKCITKTFKTILKTKISHPMVSASSCWKIIQEQLEAILGITIYNQWFQATTPMVISNNVLMLYTETNFAAQWLNNHYKELIDALIQAQDPQLSCFFIPKCSNVKKLRF